MSSVFIVAWSDPAHFNSKVMDKRYEKALERAKQGMPIDEVFPELRESEDERIIGNIKKAVELYWSDEPLDEILSWLEKHKEQKSAEWRPFDKEVLTKIKELIDSHFSEHEQREVYKDWLDEHISQPAEWSEEDEAFLKVAIAICNRYSHKDIADWLKSLRSRPHWKPSEEQIQALTVAIDEAARCEEHYWRDSLHDVLLSLHTDLKKLL
jgi:hypothetical protein